MRLQYGAEQMERQEWLLNQLQTARARRQQHRAFEMRRFAAAAGDYLESVAVASGAVLGAAGSLSVRGLGALASGARQGAIAAWGGVAPVLGLDPPAPRPTTFFRPFPRIRLPRAWCPAAVRTRSTGKQCPRARLGG